MIVCSTCFSLNPLIPEASCFMGGVCSIGERCAVCGTLNLTEIIYEMDKGGVDLLKKLKKDSKFKLKEVKRMESYLGHIPVDKIRKINDFVELVVKAEKVINRKKALSK